MDGGRKTVVFDLDGTLVDTAADLIAAANATLAEQGAEVRLDPVLDARIAYHGGRAMLRAAHARLPAPPPPAPGAEDRAFARLLVHYAAAVAVHSRPYPGVAGALERLAAAGYVLAVCTNKPLGLAEALLAELDLRRHFAAVIGADSLPVRKPDPRPYHHAVAAAGGAVGRSFLIGDTVTDRDTARAAGVRIAMVGFGPEGAGVARLAPDAVLDHFDALPDLAARWLG